MSGARRLSPTVGTPRGRAWKRAASLFARRLRIGCAGLWRLSRRFSSYSALSFTALFKMSREKTEV